MVTRLLTLNPETDAFERIARVLQANVTGAPVIDAHDNNHGVFSDRWRFSVLTATVESAGIEAITHGNWHAGDVMAKNLVTLTPGMDAFDAIAMLLKRRISGTPVTDEGGRFIGSFSEKTSMNLLFGAAYDQIPTCQVRAFMDTGFGRVIDEHADLLRIAQLFRETQHRRLPVVRHGKLLGLVSRRDLLCATNEVIAHSPQREKMLLYLSATTDRADAPIY